MLVPMVFRNTCAWAFFGSLRQVAQQPMPLRMAAAAIPAAEATSPQQNT